VLQVGKFGIQDIKEAHTMKRISYKLIIIIVVFVTLTVSALALHVPEDQTLGDDAVMIPDEELSEEPMMTNDEYVNSDMIDFNGKTVPLTESMKAVVDNIILKESGYEITEWKISSNDAKMIDRDTALETALTEVQKMAARQAYAEKVNIALVKFSNLILPKIPESDISLTEIPVWLVTFENVEIRRGSSMPREEPATAPAVVHVIIDAYSGEWLITRYYGIGE
jgi:hypothetical protein